MRVLEVRSGGDLGVGDGRFGDAGFVLGTEAVLDGTATLEGERRGRMVYCAVQRSDGVVVERPRYARGVNADKAMFVKHIAVLDVPKVNPFWRNHVKMYDRGVGNRKEAGRLRKEGGVMDEKACLVTSGLVTSGLVTSGMVDDRGSLPRKSYEMEEDLKGVRTFEGELGMLNGRDGYNEIAELRGVVWDEGRRRRVERVIERLGI